MNRRVTIVDYGVGNISSVRRAFEHFGAAVTVANSPEDILQADRVVLPGVGAFSDGMAELKQRGLVDPIRAFVAFGRPFLGICLGMQMMLESSEEFGRHEGLGLIPGRVVAIPATGADGTPHKVPHTGWNKLIMPGNNRWQRSLLEQTVPGSSVYFVHSFAVIPDRPEHRLADCDYNGRVICAAVSSGSAFGCQFHPEKSAAVGLEIISKFLTF